MGTGNKECFVLMGFGVKVDYKTSRSLDMDKTYKVIQSAVTSAGFECIRSNDIIHSGMIDARIYQHLLTADVAVADLSTSNENAIYELGVRHALRPYTTIVIAESQFKFPFDLQGLRILRYEHLGSGIDFEEAERLRNELRVAIETITKRRDVDSPLYSFLPRLRQPALDQSTADAAARAGATVTAGPSFSALLEDFREARKRREFAVARTYLIKLRESSPEDPYLVQQHALATCEIEPVTVASLTEARDILRILQPHSSGDPETLGLWGSIHKRLWELTGERGALDEAIAAYERGYRVNGNHYTGINLAFMLDQRAVVEMDPDERTADHTLARRIRRQLLATLDENLKAMPHDAHGKVQDPAELYWLRATRLETLLGLRDAAFEQVRGEVLESAPEPWMRDTTERQLEKLAALLPR